MPALVVVMAAAASTARHEVGRGADLERRLHEALVREAAAQAGSAERARLARDLHDRLASTLQGLALSAAAVRMLARTDPAAAADCADGLSRDASAAVRQARELVEVRRRHPEEPLEVAVRGVVHRWTADTGTPATVRCAAAPAIGPAAVREVLAVLGEALTNVARHAGARAVEVRIGASTPGDDGPPRLVLTVADDGRGPGGPRRPGRYGITGMTERAALLGGRLTVSAGNRGGTLVTLEVPATDDGPVGTVHALRVAHGPALAS
jgi:signal transduction histidine kinase